MLKLSIGGPDIGCKVLAPLYIALQPALLKPEMLVSQAQLLLLGFNRPSEENRPVGGGKLLVAGHITYHRWCSSNSLLLHLE